MLSSLLVFQYGQARVWFAMSRDGLLPAFFSRVHPKFKTPHVSTWVAGWRSASRPAFGTSARSPILSNIGTLFAFIVVSAGVIALRRKQPERPRGFRVPLVPLLPILSMVLLPAFDAGSAARNLDSFLRLARHRAGDLLHVWPPSVALIQLVPARLSSMRHIVAAIVAFWLAAMSAAPLAAAAFQSEGPEYGLLQAEVEELLLPQGSWLGAASDRCRFV